MNIHNNIHTEDEDTKRRYRITTIPGWLAFSMVIIFVIILIVVIYLQFKRYEFIGKSLDKGDTVSAALLFTPELSRSVASLLYSV